MYVNVYNPSRDGENVSQCFWPDTKTRRVFDSVFGLPLYPRW